MVHGLMTRRELESCNISVTVILHGCPRRRRVLEAVTRDISRSRSQQFGLDLEGSREPYMIFIKGVTLSYVHF